MSGIKLNVNQGGALNRPSPTHWSNAFTFRRRATATADEKGKPVVLLNTDMLDIIGVKPGEDVIMSIDNLGRIIVARPEIQLTD